MSTLGGLFLPQFAPFDLGRTLQQATQIAGGRTSNETALIQLAELKRQQQQQAAETLFYQQHPELALGQSTLGSLQAGGGGPPGGGPMMQQQVMPGQPPGVPQLVPGGQDMSRFAGVSPQGGGPIPPGVMGQGMPTVTPPPGTLGSLGPQPQGPAQPNPLLELARRDPRAAMAIQAQQQQQQQMQWKLEEQQLDRGVKVAEFVARELEGVTDQASTDAARERIRQVHPQAAAQVPQFYSKEAIAQVRQRGIAVADKAKWDLANAQARKANVEADLLPGAMTALRDWNTGGTTPAPAGTAAPGAGTQAGTTSPAFDSAITDANRLYPQVPATRIKSIIAAESNFDPWAVSSAGAKGPMQLMDATARRMGVDDPFDVQQNVRGGTRYYAQMLTKYGGDERKALTAYNWGPGNLDEVGGDVTQAPAKTQAYVAKVLGGGGGTGQAGPGAPPTDPRVADLTARITQGEALATNFRALGAESTAVGIEKRVENMRQERDRMEAPQQAYRTEAATQPLKLAQQRAGAEVQLEAKMNEPIGTENAVKMNLPAETKWKDVPKGTQVLERTPEGAGAKFGEYKASYDGMTRVIGMLDNPKARSIIGTLLSSEDNAAFRRLAGEWISSVTPEERKFTASLVGELASIRHNLSGAAVTPTEAEFLKPMMPSVADPDVGTVRAKLEALQEWVARKHEGLRDQLAQTSVRTPKPLRPPAPPGQTSGGGETPASPTATKPVGEMTLEEAKAERARLLAQGGR